MLRAVCLDALKHYSNIETLKMVYHVHLHSADIYGIIFGGNLVPLYDLCSWPRLGVICSMTKLFQKACSLSRPFRVLGTWLATMFITSTNGQMTGQTRLGGVYQRCADEI